jgi:hypothetical protein
MAALRIVVEDDSLDRVFVQTEPGVELIPFQPPANEVVEWKGTGAERGEYEDRASGRRSR